MRIQSLFLVIFGQLVLVPPVHAEAAVQEEKPEKYPRISFIEVRGNMVLTRSAILTAAGLKAGDRAMPSALSAARRNMLQTGLFGMHRPYKPEEAVKLSLVKFSKATNEARLIISVDENEIVKSFNITGNGPIPPSELLGYIQTKPNYVLNINTLRADVERIQLCYDRKGYVGNVSEEGFGLTKGILNIPIVVYNPRMEHSIHLIRKTLVRRKAVEVRRTPQTNGIFD